MPQRYCPDCRMTIGRPESSETSYQHGLQKHRGSAKCRARAEVYQQAREEMRAELETGRVPEEAPMPPGAMRERVVFCSPVKNLKIWLREPVYSRDANQNQHLEQAGIVAQFRDGEFETSDPEVIRLMRMSPSNQERIARLSSPTAALRHKDRFYEATAAPLAQAV